MCLEKVYLTNQVKLEILTICGLPDVKPYNLNGLTSLLALGCNTNLQCKLLESKLQDIAHQYNTGRLVKADAISFNLTVNECIKLIFEDNITPVKDR